MLTGTPRHADEDNRKELVAADTFRKNISIALSNLPAIEVIHMANKIITAVSHLNRTNPETIYKEILQLIDQNPRNIENARIFHTIIDLYIDRIVGDGTVQQQSGIHAWISLDELTRIFMTVRDFLYGADPRKLNEKDQRTQKAICTIITGVQTRKTQVIRGALQDNLLRNPEIVDIIDHHLWEIERHLN